MELQIEEEPYKEHTPGLDSQEKDSGTPKYLEFQFPEMGHGKFVLAISVI